MALLGLGDLAGALLSGNDTVALETLSDDSLLGLLGVIDGLGAAAAQKDKARKKVFNAIKHKSKNINRETKDLTAKALFEQRLAQLPADAQAKLRSGQWQLVPFIYYAVKDISGQNHADLFKSVIRELVEKGKYVVMSSHQMEVVEEFCENIVILHHGNAVVQGNLNEIKKSYGRVNLIVKCEQEFRHITEEMGIPTIKETPDFSQLKVTGDDQAKELLKKLVGEGITVVRFELKEPSLHDIFVEKAKE